MWYSENRLEITETPFQSHLKNKTKLNKTKINIFCYIYQMLRYRKSGATEDACGGEARGCPHQTQTILDGFSQLQNRSTLQTKLSPSARLVVPLQNMFNKV